VPSSVQVLKGKDIGLVTMANYEEAYTAISDFAPLKGFLP
jgi:hypothetical protein